jgi:hypothetical protein
MQRDYMVEHRPHFGTAYFVNLSNVEPGDVITFEYKDKQRWVFVLDPDYEKKLHGLTLELTPRNVLENKIIDSMYDTDKPLILYERRVYQVAKDFDSYRTYFIKDMKLVRRMPYYLKEKPVIKKGSK